MSKEHLAKFLTYAGTLPFILCMIASNTIFQNGLSFGTITLNLDTILIAYGAVIASFIAGIHWGVYLFKSDEAPLNLFIHSNIVALLAWTSFMLPHGFACIVLIFCFAYLLKIDYGLSAKNIIEPWFYRIRIHASVIVSAILGLDVLHYFLA